MRRLSIFIVTLLVLMIPQPSFAIRFTVEPAYPSIYAGDCLELSIYLDDWYEVANVFNVSCYMKHDIYVSSLGVVSFAPEWDEHAFYPSLPGGDAYLEVQNFGPGVTGPKMLLATVDLCTYSAINSDFLFEVTLEPSLYVTDVTGHQYSNVIPAGKLIDIIPTPCECCILGPTEVQADNTNPVTATYNASCNSRCGSMPVYVFSDDCVHGSIDQNTGVFTVPAFTSPHMESCTITVTDTANTDNNTGDQIVCTKNMLILSGGTYEYAPVCKGNFDYDKDVDGTDASTFKQHFGRSAFSNPCPKDGPSPVSRTGQVTNWFPYDDGSTQCGIASPSLRFTHNIDNNGDGDCYDFGETCDGTVTDNLTGLIWLKYANCLTANQTCSQAMVACNALKSGDCGLHDGSIEGDWRLPTMRELLSIVDFGKTAPATPDRMFNDVNSACDGYCHSTPYILDKDYTLIINLWYGSLYYMIGSANFGAVCVNTTHPYCP